MQQLLILNFILLLFVKSCSFTWKKQESTPKTNVKELLQNYLSEEDYSQIVQDAPTV